MLLMWLMTGCQRELEPLPEDTQQVAQPQELCQDTFPADQVSDEDITEYGLELPTRESALPELLSQTPLYADILNKDIHPAVHAFTPSYQLWSDAADKQRWVYLPECTPIDTSNMNDWQFPVGTRFFKEFSVDGRRIETRIIERIGTGPRDFAFASYLWNESETEAQRVSPQGIRRAHGTDHDVPSHAECLRCHGTYSLGGGRLSRGLGFSAIQLSHENEGLTLSALIDDGQLSHPPDTEIRIPGTEQEQAVLGYLHANCGNCHNDSKDGLPQFDMNLWLNVEHTTPQETGLWQTAISQETQIFKDQHVSGRIVAGSPQSSALFYRMSQRGNIAQMPPIASKMPDHEGLMLIADWIEALP